MPKIEEVMPNRVKQFVQSIFPGSTLNGLKVVEVRYDDKNYDGPVAICEKKRCGEWTEIPEGEDVIYVKRFL
jgi:hypothetical protein